MKPRTILALLAATTLAFATAVAAESGPLRERVKERVADRLGDRAAQDAPPAASLRPRQKITAPGRYEIHLRHDGRDRMALLHVPANWQPGRATPLVVALHGGGGSALHQANDHNYGLITKSEEAGFIVLFPNGISPSRTGMLATWNAGNCCSTARDQNVDDVGFLRRLVEDVEGRLRIDTARVYATGMSNGSMMSYRLACEADDIFKAIMAVAGTDNTRSCAPRNPVPVLHIHALDDDRELFNGGSGDKFRGKDEVTEFVSVPDSIAKWVKLDRANPLARRVLEVPGAYCERHDALPGDAPVQLCVTETGGHSWPGGSKGRGAAPPSTAINASDLMWEFFSGL